MRIFVAGATGQVGRLLIPMLIAGGHQVTGIGRSADGVRALAEQGAAGVRVDVYDRAALAAAVREAAPDVLVHQLTALSGGSLADNARIRHEGTRNLVDAAKAAGVRRLVAQSIAWAYAPGDTPATEETPLDPAADGARAVTVDGVRALETQAAEVVEHVVLRYGMFYGPGTWYHREGRVGRQLLAGDFTANDGVTSFLHIEDAALAAAQAVSWPAGVYNIVDDQPLPSRVWAAAFAEALGAPPPRVVPGRAAWERGADNSLARAKLSWTPKHPLFRTT
ncbi:dTDP-glucose 4,6-dehydratase [Actinoplanes ianthinogenes]|uniref:dTDP-glucose 4,6-dehydratase n=1 Tax=Actinoplanes ianthinogenes TaxID=122358 RepID=A0ABM7M9R3_9ACTN|nr:NAD(P)-dependent oxidoreductase [Actinoplanes ianthinogenes]BCJ48415.1 dTDP-glucose 4,6-dehydratase [Actinoplanes ianthinogenes]GGR46549.1 dTDP-glucose 4,6-dehydratase [Actinoplanes ianthinogenes]